MPSSETQRLAVDWKIGKLEDWRCSILLLFYPFHSGCPCSFLPTQFLTVFQVCIIYCWIWCMKVFCGGIAKCGFRFRKNWKFWTLTMPTTVSVSVSAMTLGCALSSSHWTAPKISPGSRSSNVTGSPSGGFSYILTRPSLRR